MLWGFGFNSFFVLQQLMKNCKMIVLISDSLRIISYPQKKVHIHKTKKRGNLLQQHLLIEFKVYFLVVTFEHSFLDTLTHIKLYYSAARILSQRQMTQ